MTTIWNIQKSNQYGIIEPLPPVETLPNSTTLSSPDIPNTYTARELVESQGNATKTLPTEGVDNKEVRCLVESGRELQEGEEGKNKISEFVDSGLQAQPGINYFSLLIF